VPGKVIDKNYDFTGIAADPRFKIDAQLATDTIGRPLFIGQDTPARRTVRQPRRLPDRVQQGRLREVLACR
jgi:hypothetical protein